MRRILILGPILAIFLSGCAFMADPEPEPEPYYLPPVGSGGKPARKLEITPHEITQEDLNRMNELAAAQSQQGQR